MSNISRRDFLKTGAAAIAGFTIAPSSVLGKSFGHISPSDKMNIAVVGIGGMGHANINAVKDTENIVALCYVNWEYAKGVFDEFPKAKRYWDYRKMYDEMAKSIDGVIIANASEARFPNTELDARLLYVCLTRPLHRLACLYEKTLTPLLAE